MSLVCPALAEAQERLHNRSDWIPLKQRLEILGTREGHALQARRENAFEARKTARLEKVTEKAAEEAAERAAIMAADVTATYIMNITFRKINRKYLQMQSESIMIHCRHSIQRLVRM